MARLMNRDSFPSRSSAITSVLVILTAMTSDPAAAKIPMPCPISDVPALMVICPAGDIEYKVVTRTLANNPWSRDFVTIDFCPCRGFRFAPIAAGPYVMSASGCSVSVMPDYNGISRFALSGGGNSTADTVVVWADGIRLCELDAVVPLDQDGDLAVGEPDRAIVRAKLGSHAPEADFDGDGVVTELDVRTLEQHLGHVHPDSSTPARATSWGRIKRLWH